MSEFTPLSSLSEPGEFAAPPQRIAPPGLAARLHAVWRSPRTPRVTALAIAAWLATIGNLALWTMLWKLASEGEMGIHPLRLAAGMLLIVFCSTGALLTMFAWRWTFLPVALALLVIAAAVQHFMLAYGIVVDPSMVANALQTNYTEARDLVSWGLAGELLLVAGPPAAWLLQLRLRPERIWPHAWRNALSMVMLAGVAAGCSLVQYRELAPLMRNNLELRFIANPIAPVFSTLSAVTRPWRKHRMGPLVAISAGAELGPGHAAAGAANRPPLLVLVIGETARADHFGLNGYGRDTTPALASHGAVSFTEVRSCWTNTMVSVPCMFSSLGKEAWLKRSAEYENLLDVLQAAGLAVLWLDNQAGCKGVCDRVPHAATADEKDRRDFAPARNAADRLCRDGDCLDDVMLAGLEDRIAALDPKRRARGVVLVMHQMGSHGPAYYRRSSLPSKRFLPECDTHALATCDHQALINVYDNSIAETDLFLGHTIDWLSARSDRYATGMLYLSDHGESLGEYGLFLHGLPYSVAPDEQKHVPVALWMDDRMARRTQTDRSCLQARRAEPMTHDFLYSSVLGLLDVQTPTYRAPLDAFAPCRAPVADLAKRAGLPLG